MSLLVTRGMMHDDVKWYCKCGQVTQERHSRCWRCEGDRRTNEVIEPGYGRLAHLAIDGTPSEGD